MTRPALTAGALGPSMVPLSTNKSSSSPPWKAGLGKVEIWYYDRFENQNATFRINILENEMTPRLIMGGTVCMCVCVCVCVCVCLCVCVCVCTHTHTHTHTHTRDKGDLTQTLKTRAVGPVSGP